MSDLHKHMSDAFDKELLRLLTRGREVVNRDGDRELIEPTAADLNVIRQRLKDCGITVEANATNPVGNIVEEMRRRGMKMPVLDLDGEDAATA